MAAQAVQPHIYANPIPQRSTRPAPKRSAKAVRRARTLTVLFILLVAALVLFFPRVVHTQNHSEMALVTYTVVAGDTLWEIASHHAGDRDLREVIHQIEKVNQLKGQSIQPGQVLTIPATPGSQLAGR